MKNKIRLAIVGTGYFSQFHYDAWERLNAEVVAICSLNKNEALARSKQFKNCRVFIDFKTMINETDANLVDIIIPPENHLILFRFALRQILTLFVKNLLLIILKKQKRLLKLQKNTE